jgi:tetratricopeptide (TPR) repeat protein
VSRRPWIYLIPGVLILLVASNRTAGLLARTLRPYLPPFALAALADPRALWHVVGVIAGLALVGAGAFVWFLGRREPPPLTSNTPRPGSAAPSFGHTPSAARPKPAPPRTPSASRPRPVPPHTPLPGTPAPRTPPQHTPPRASFEPLPLTNDAKTAEETGEYERAGELYDRRHDDGAAARAYAKAARDAVPGSPERTSLVNRCLNRARKAGNQQIAIELLADVGEMHQAIELARSSGDARTTAALMRRAGDHAGAAGVLSAAGDTAGAAQIMVEAGNVNGALEFLAVEDPAAAAKLAVENGDFERAVELYLKAGQPGEAAALVFEEDPRRAGELYLQAGDAISAAGAFEHAGSKADAAEAWLRAGQPERANPLFEALGDDAGLARSRELAGDFLGATRILLRLGRLEDAQQTLGRLSAEELITPAASILAADCLMQAHRVDEAIPVLLDILQHANLDETLQCESCYLLGVAYLGKHENARAESLLHQVTLLNPQYRDARRLLARIGKKTLPPEAPDEA